MKKLVKIFLNKVCNIFIYSFVFKGKIEYKSFNSIGIPDFTIAPHGEIINDGYIEMVNTARMSTLGKANRCKLAIFDNAILHFYGKVGMSNTTIIATKKIEIGNNVMIGGGVIIVDTDFHSLDYINWFSPNDQLLMIRKSVKIGDNVFLGMDSIILKGVTIGDGAIVAAGAVVSRDIPQNEIWGGNPARFIKKRQ